METGPETEEKIVELMPNFRAPSNYKNPEAIASYQEEQKRKWISEAALDATTARVLCIGILHGDKFMCMGDKGETEAEIVSGFWQLYDTWLYSFSGFNIFGFDLPLLVRRSYALKLQMPHSVRDGRWWNHRFMDVLDKWQLGDRKELISLDRLAKFLGLGAKLSDGSQFAGLWMASKQAAIDYLRRDLELTRAIAQRMEGFDCVPLPRPEDTDNIP